MTKTLILSAITAALLTGCAATKINTTAPFDKDEMAEKMQPGNNTITGSGFIRQRNGGTVTCAGNTVELIPEMAYSRERMEAYFGNKDKGYKTVYQIKSIQVNEGYRPEEYINLRRTTECDAQGFFKFDKVKDGSYFLVTNVLWSLQYTTEGGALMRRVEVANGETKSTVLAP